MRKRIHKYTKKDFDKIREEFENVVEQATEARKPKTNIEILEDIEARFLGWTYLSNQQEEDFSWLINTLRGEIRDTRSNKSRGS